MSFDTLAPYYRAMELVLAGSLLQRCRTAFLTETGRARSALLLGEGPGRYLVELLRANPHVTVTCLDSSARMQAIARRRASEAGFARRQLRFVCTDWADWCPDSGSFDLVVTHFFLDCFPDDELARLIAKISALMLPNASWVLSDFRVPEGGWRRVRARLVLGLAYTFFRITTGLNTRRLPSVAPLLESAGFELREQQLFNYDLLHAQVWQR